MSRLHDRQDKLTITDYLRMGKTSKINVVNADGSTTEIDMTELKQLSKADLIEVVTTTNVIEASETGKTFILNTATAFVSTLPAPAAGLEFTFRIGATEPTTSHTVVTNASANIINGNLCSPEDAAGSVSVAVDSDTVSFIASKALHGDYAHFWSDGTNWYLDGMCSVQDGMTATQAS